MHNIKFLIENARITDAYASMYARRNISESSENDEKTCRNPLKGELPIDGTGSSKTGSKLGVRKILPFEKRDERSSVVSMTPPVKDIEPPKKVGESFEDDVEDFENDEVVDTDSEDGVEADDCERCGKCDEVLDLVLNAFEQIYDNLSDDDKETVDEVKAEIETFLNPDDEDDNDEDEDVENDDEEDGEDEEEIEDDDSIGESRINEGIVKAGIKAALKNVPKKAVKEVPKVTKRIPKVAKTGARALDQKAAEEIGKELRQGAEIGSKVRTAAKTATPKAAPKATTSKTAAKGAKPSAEGSAGPSTEVAKRPSNADMSTYKTNYKQKYDECIKAGDSPRTAAFRANKYALTKVPKAVGEYLGHRTGDIAAYGGAGTLAGIGVGAATYGINSTLHPDDNDIPQYINDTETQETPSKDDIGKSLAREQTARQNRASAEGLEMDDGGAFKDRRLRIKQAEHIKDIESKLPRFGSSDNQTDATARNATANRSDSANQTDSTNQTTAPTATADEQK